MNFLAEECKRGATVMISTNIASELQGYASHLCILQDQEIVLAGEISQLVKGFTKIKGDVTSDIKEAREVGLNSDGTRSFIVKNDEVNLAMQSITLDRRGITVADIASYYSMGEVVHG